MGPGRDPCAGLVDQDLDSDGEQRAWISQTHGRTAEQVRRRSGEAIDVGKTQ